MTIDPKNYGHLRHIKFTELLPQNENIGKNKAFSQVQYQLLIGEPSYSDLIDETQFPFMIKTDNPDPNAVEPSAFRTFLGWSLCGGWNGHGDNEDILHPEDLPGNPVRMVKARIFHTKTFKNPEQEFVFNALVKKYDTDFNEETHDQKFLKDIQMLWNLETIGVEANQFDKHGYTKEEDEALALMKELTKFDPEKRRWTTRLLWSNPKRKVRNTNEFRALTVAKSLERKYMKANTVLAKYITEENLFLPQINNALLEFLNNHFMTLATAEEKAMTKIIIICSSMQLWRRAAYSC